MSKQKLSIGALAICSLIIICILMVLKANPTLKQPAYLTTSYSADRTVIVGDGAIKSYPIKCVDTVYDLSIGRLLANKYGNQALLLHGEEPDIELLTFEYFDICDIKENNGYIYILFSFALNRCKIVKYDLSFNVVCESSDFQGVPRNIVVREDDMYLVVNDYDDSARKIVLSKISPITLTEISIVEIDSLTFAFYGEIIDDNVIIYGNTDEEEFAFGIGVYDKSLSYIDTLSYDTSALWVRKVIDYNGYQYILNDFSIIKMGSDYKLIGVFSKTDYLIIDAVVNEGLLYVLSSQTGSEVEIDAIDTTTFTSVFKKRMSEGLEYDYMIPSCFIADQCFS